MKFNKYFFGDMLSEENGAPDPRKILNSNDTDESLYKLVCAGPGKLRAADIPNASLLEDIGILRSVEGRLYVACPIFVDSDADILRRITCECAERIAEKLYRHRKTYCSIVEKLENGFDAKVNLYNLLCGAVFDGCFFDRLAAAGAVTVSKPQKNGMDYLPVIYEDSYTLNELSAKILCSYNRLTAAAGTFSSFGDADGERNDLYRWYSNYRTGKFVKQTPVEKLVGVHDLPEIKELLVSEFAKAANGIVVSEEYTDIFEYFGYMKEKRICIPVYTSEDKENIVKPLDEFTAGIVLDDMIASLNTVASSNELTTVRHEVPTGDIANEVYHLLFGQINEKLVACGMAAAPEYHPGEGRYLKSFEIK